jgi:hypothetical protein
MLAHILRSTLLIKNFDFQCSHVAVAHNECKHELETRAASTTPASATGASDLTSWGPARGRDLPVPNESCGFQVGRHVARGGVHEIRGPLAREAVK